MNQLLSKQLKDPKAKEAFQAWWDNAGAELEVLARALFELAGDGKVKEADLKGGDALATLAYKAGRRAALLDVLDLLPEHATKDILR